MADEPVTEERVIRALSDIAFADLSEVKAGEKMKALELLGKHLGMWKDRETELAAEQSRLSELLELWRGKRDGP